MKSNRARNERPRGLKPVQTVELSEKNIRARWFFAAAFLVLGLAAFGLLIHEWLTEDPGWVNIEASASQISCGEDFIFSYCLGEGELSPTEEKKQVTALYSEAAREAYCLFHSSLSFEGYVNLHDLNTHPNETFTVAPALYRALAQFAEEDSRAIYQGALLAEYGKLFFGGEPHPSASSWDPYVSEELAAFYRKLADFAADPASVELVLGEENQVTLRVSEEYLAYAREADLSLFVDFGRLKNAFVADYLAERLKERGFVFGVLSSYDGYVRNLDPSETSYSLNLFQLRGAEVYQTARMEYGGNTAMVTLRAFPLGEKDGLSFCVLPNGGVITPYFDPADGKYLTAADSLTAYAKDQSCARLALKLYPVYVAEELNTDALRTLAQSGIHSVWMEDTVIRHTDPSLILRELYADAELSYRTETVSDSKAS